MTLWSGRFSSAMSSSLWDLSESYSFDHVLYAHDIMGSKAHVSGLNAAGLLSDDESALLTSTLDQIAREFASGEFVRHHDDEDIHMAIERRATELAGPVGAKIHTARSRNDQVATTLRLFTRDALDELASLTLSLAGTLVEVAAKTPDAYLPGYTHLQRAQPVLLAHHLYAHAWSLLRDVDRLLDNRERMNVSPLGAGALAGTSLPIDPAIPARLLNFEGPFTNSMDAVSDRDFVAETLFDVAMLGVHLSRMGEELVLWTSSEFGFASLGDDFTTGSSMLPQKKNSDVAELTRGKSGRLIGNLTALLVTLKGLPLSYNRDLQEDKEPLFDSIVQSRRVLVALAGAYGSMEFHAALAQRAADDEMLVAIDIAERLVERGVPFRQAHERVGRAVGDAVRGATSLSEVVRASEDLAEFQDLFDRGRALENRSSPGGAGPGPVARQREQLLAALAQAEDRSATLRVG
ncbi:MAG TPA: argininosuccinate lyase [Acidimicrobiales bacterium]|nr:argininosuccinate lyase [Acidimicrobiales bacterium]